MPYHFLEFFFILALLFLPWVIQQIKDNRDRAAVVYCCDESNFRTMYLVSINKLLPDGYRVGVKELTSAETIYQEYQLWLLMRYAKKELAPALYDYHMYLSRKNRKLFHTDQLEPYFGSAVREELFFFETLCYFLDVQVNIHGTWPDIRKHAIYTWRTSDEEILTDIGIVAYKIMLAVHIAHETIGLDRAFQIEGIKKWLDKSCV